MGIQKKEGTTHPSQILTFPKEQYTLGNSSQAVNEKTSLWQHSVKMQMKHSGWALLDFGKTGARLGETCSAKNN